MIDLTTGQPYLDNETFFLGKLYKLIINTNHHTLRVEGDIANKSNLLLMVLEAEKSNIKRLTIMCVL